MMNKQMVEWLLNKVQEECKIKEANIEELALLKDKYLDAIPEMAAIANELEFLEQIEENLRQVSMDPDYLGELFVMTDRILNYWTEEVVKPLTQLNAQEITKELVQLGTIRAKLEMEQITMEEIETIENWYSQIKQ